jgi:serine phosphatase RsbU (regulator of sigma subunit)
MGYPSPSSARSFNELARTVQHLVKRESETRRLIRAERAAHFADAQALAELRTELVPTDLPDVPGIDITAWHEPASDGNDVLGDFYDVFPSGDKRWNIVLGDVCGHGAAAAKRTALVRYSLRTALMHHLDPGDALAEVDTIVRNDRQDPGRFATVTYLSIDMTRPGTIIRANAGHPPPLLREPDGSTRWLTDANATPIGIKSAAQYGTAVVDLQPGSVILLYTDGAIDARSSNGERFGQERLERLMATAPAGNAKSIVAHIADGILAHAERNLIDDIALLVLRR